MTSMSSDSRPSDSSSSGSSNRPYGMRRSRIMFLVGAVIVLVFGATFAMLTRRALYVRAHTSSVFNQYVLDHHIGHAEISDDASGFQGDFCVLYVNHRIPDAELKDQALHLLYEYHDLDGGDILSIQYNVPGQEKRITLADAVFHPDSQSVSLSLNLTTGKQLMTIPVHWETSGDAS
jgi:hypothetical protein